LAQLSRTIPAKAWAYGRSLAGILGSNPAGGLGRLSVVIVVCCPVEVSATGRSLVQRAPIECGSVCPSVILKYQKRGGPGPLRGCCARKNITLQKIIAECIVVLVNS
jgi:hypothetical protein